MCCCSGLKVLKFKREPCFSFFPYRFFLLRIGGRVLGTGCLGPSSEDLGASVQLFLQRPVLLSVSFFLLHRTSGPQNRLSGFFITLTTRLSCAGNQYQRRAQYWSLPRLGWNFTIIIKKALLCALHMDALKKMHGPATYAFTLQALVWNKSLIILTVEAFLLFSPFFGWRACAYGDEVARGSHVPGRAALAQCLTFINGLACTVDADVLLSR